MKREIAIKWLKVIVYVGVYGGLLMPVFFWPVVIFPFVYSKLSFFQFLIGLTFPAYLILAWAEPQYRPKRSMLYITIIAYFVAIAASTIFSVDPVRSWWGNQERMNGLFTLLHFFAWLTMAIGLIRTWEQWRKLLIYEICLSAFMAVIALLQKPFPSLLSFPAGPRVGGLLDNPIYMGAYQIFNLFFIALLWMRGPTSRSMKAVYAMIGLLDVGAFIAAQSRGALLGFAVGIFVFLVSIAVMTTNKKFKKIVFGVMIAGVACYGLLFATRNTAFVQNNLPSLIRFTNFTEAADTRFIAWNIAWDGFVERPVFGWGFDAFHILFNQKYNPVSLEHGYYETWFDRSHNTIMDVLSMTGIFGFVTFAALWIVLYATVIRARRRGDLDIPTTAVFLGLPVAYFVQNLLVFDHPAAFSMSYLLFAIIIALTHDHRVGTGGNAQKPAISRSIPWILFGLLEIAAVLLVWKTTVLPFKASRISIQSNSAFGQGQYEKSFTLAKQASTIWTPYLDEQTFLQSRNYIQLAASGHLKEYPFWKDWHDLIVRITEAHLVDHSKNVHPHFIFARFLDSMGQFVPEDYAKAEEQYKKTIELSPKRQQMFFSVARLMVTLGRLNEATTYLQQAVSVDENLGEAHWMLGVDLLFDRKQVAEGAMEIAKSQTVRAPYALQDAREAAILSYAYDLLGDKESLKKVVQMLPALPQAPSETYLQIAQILEQEGLIAERNLIVNALVRLDPALAIRLSPLTSGSVTSIQQALKASENIKTATPEPAAATLTAPPPQIASSTGSGPRR